MLDNFGLADLRVVRRSYLIRPFTISLIGVQGASVSSVIGGRLKLRHDIKCVPL
jgi:hypothetical protein